MTSNYENIFYQALRIRMVEEKITELYPSDKIQSPVHLSVGQEHHIAAIMTQLNKDDQVFTTYRGHAVYLAKGGDLKKMFAELYGKATGISKGRAGSMHLTDPQVNMMGSSAIVGATLSHTLAQHTLLSFSRKTMWWFLLPATVQLKKASSTNALISRRLKTSFALYYRE